jgi:3D (Asp-Asp-Asp) domain-containing protein
MKRSFWKRYGLTLATLAFLALSVTSIFSFGYKKGVEQAKEEAARHNCGYSYRKEPHFQLLEGEFDKVLKVLGNLTSETQNELQTQTGSPKEEIQESEIPREEEAQLVSLGEFRITAYCPCKECSGKWGTKTSTGATATAGRTVAVDPDVIPYGTELVIDGRTYIAEDCGSAIKNNSIDIYFDEHSETVQHGVQYKEVFIYGE